MCALKAVRKLASELGATVEDTKDLNTHECRVTAPNGKRWADQLHEFVDCAYRPWKPDYADLLDRMGFGLEDCDNPDCDWCER